MPFRGVEEYLRDIIENIEVARDFVTDRTLEEFKADRRTNYAVIRALEIVSEASRHLGAEIEARHPHID